MGAPIQLAKVTLLVLMIVVPLGLIEAFADGDSAGGRNLGRVLNFSPQDSRIQAARAVMDNLLARDLSELIAMDTMEENRSICEVVECNYLDSSQVNKLVRYAIAEQGRRETSELGQRQNFYAAIAGISALGSLVLSIISLVITLKTRQRMDSLH